VSLAAASTGPRHELDLWHPTGAPVHRLALGGRGTTDGGRHGAGIDIAVVAPGPAEVNRAWLQGAIGEATARLARDGVLWVIVPRRWRRTAERTLARSGLAQLDAVLTVPAWPRTAHLIPIAPETLGDAGLRHLGLAPAVARAASVLARTNAGVALLRRTAPGCALLAARPPLPSAFRWLADLDGAATVATATVATGTRNDARAAVALRFPDGASAPDLVVKVPLDARGRVRLRREREALETLGAGAARAGAAVPVVRPVAVPWLLATAPLAGQPASAVLSRDAGQLGRIATAVADWLLVWGRATASATVATSAVLDELLLVPLERVAAALATPPAYRDALHRLAGRLEGHELVLTAAHNDLTMANVLDAGDGIGVIDWEDASGADLALGDLWYSLADALSHARGLTHAEAVEALVRGAPEAPAALAAAPAKLSAELSLSRDQSLLGFHACWLGHAADELQRGQSDHPFLPVVRHVASARLLWPDGDEPAAP
jgi:hypothetical protein